MIPAFLQDKLKINVRKIEKHPSPGDEDCETGETACAENCSFLLTHPLQPSSKYSQIAASEKSLTQCLTFCINWNLDPGICVALIHAFINVPVQHLLASKSPPSPVTLGPREIRF